MANAEKRSRIHGGRKGAKSGSSTPTETTEATSSEATTAPAEAKPAKPIESAQDMLARLQSEPKTRDRFKNVTAITAVGKQGPTKVIIQCADPQTKQDPSDSTKQISVCQGQREIAVQDLFQVERCVPCQERKVRIQRRETAKKKNKALRAATKKD